MIVYGSSLSPFVRKVLVFAAEKGLAPEVRPTMPGSDAPEFRAMSPFGKIPAFQDGDFAISDSTAIVTYLEAEYPDPALIPAASAARARTIWWEEFADTILVPAGSKCFFNRIVAPMMGRPQDLAAAEKAEAEELPPLYRFLEASLPDGLHLVDDRLTLADIAVASPLINLSHCAAPIDGGSYPKLAAFFAAWCERPSLAPLLAQERAMLGGKK